MTVANAFTILLVDDDALVLEALHEFFCDSYHTVLARTGSQALDTIGANPHIAAVVLDVKMAGMDGIETCQEIKKIAPGLPIIIHTGYPGKYQTQQIGTLLKPFAFVQKGSSLTQLEQAVHDACLAHSQQNASLEHDRPE